MTGTWRMVRSLARTQRMRLLAWPLAMLALTVLTAVSLDWLYPTPAERGTYAQAYGASQAMKAIGGNSGGLDQLGGMVANELAIMVLPGLGVGGILLAVAGTRREEDAGRTGLVTSRPIGRLAPLAGALITVTACAAAVALVTLGGFTALGVPLVGAESGTTGPEHGGALVYAALLWTYMMVFVGLGMVMAELAQQSRTAAVLSLSVFGVLYLVRAAVNAGGHGAGGTGGVGWSWASPLGWFDAVSPFAQMRWAPLVALAGTSVVLIGTAFLLRSRRDVDSGVFTPRPGRATARAGLGTAGGIAWHVGKTPLIGWAFGSAGFAALMGSQLPDWLEALKHAEGLVESLGMSADSTAITSITMQICALFAAAVGITFMGRWADEERAGRLSHLLAQPLGRGRLAMAVGALMVLAVVGLMALSALVYAGTGALALRDTSAADGLGPDAISAAETVTAAAVYAVPALLLCAVAALWTAWQGAAPWPAWVLFGASAVLVLLGPALDLPDAVLDAAPFNAVGEVPAESVAWGGVAAELALVAAALLAAFLRFRRRDVG